MENILANVLKQELGCAAMGKQRQELGLGNTNGKLAFASYKINSNKKGQSLIHNRPGLS